MKHSVKELYKIIGKTGLFTQTAIDNGHVTVVKTPYPNNGEAKRKNYVSHSNKPVKVYDNVQQTKVVYAHFYGEHVWFDTAEELAAHREAVRIEGVEYRLTKATATLKAAKIEYAEALAEYRKEFGEKN